MPHSRYDKIIVKIFENHFKPGIDEFEFDREEFPRVAQELRIPTPKNLGDLIYSYRFRAELPREIMERTPESKVWRITLAGPGHYRFVLSGIDKLEPNALLEEIKIPDSTPGLISLYAYSDEQALLAILRYNRLLDIFLEKAAYSLQSHLRTTVPNIGQVETDEIYVGLDKEGNHYVFPIQAKGKKDKIGMVQIEQDIEVCKHKFPGLECIPVAAQFMRDSLIALFSFKETTDGIRIIAEKHYRLIPAEEYQDQE